MSDNSFWCGYLDSYCWIGGEVVLEAVRNNVLRHRDICLKLVFLCFSLRSVELLDIK